MLFFVRVNILFPYSDIAKEYRLAISNKYSLLVKCEMFSSQWNSSDLKRMSAKLEKQSVTSPNVLLNLLVGQELT